MDITEILALVTSSLGISAGTAWLLTKKLIDHKLSKERDKTKLILTAELRKEVESALGDKAADREYHLEAKKRLYTVIGPLKFQLLLACRDLSGRIIGHGLRNAYDTDISDYYGKSCLYRILRPFALCELVERQIAYADFSVDHNAIDILKFKKSAFAAFSGGSLVKGRSDVSWEDQSQHVFFDCLSRSANALITRDDNGSERVLRFHELETMLQSKGNKKLFTPFPEIFSDFTPSSKPLFWLRLVGLANLSNEYINNSGKDIGFEVREFPLTDLLRASQDKEICGDLAEYEERCRYLPESPL